MLVEDVRLHWKKVKLTQERHHNLLMLSRSFKDALGALGDLAELQSKFGAEVQKVLGALQELSSFFSGGSLQECMCPRKIPFIPFCNHGPSAFIIPGNQR